MTDAQTQVNLALYVGETYAEIEAQDLQGISLFKKKFFLPQVSLKSALNQIKKNLQADNQTVNHVYIVCRYFEKLKQFRLGGSVVQLIHAGSENNYTLENTQKLSLAASSLIIAVEDNFSAEWLQENLARVKKSNPEANKVVFSLDKNRLKAEDFENAEKFFTESGFKIFHSSDVSLLDSARHVLLNAGTEGTKEELLTDIKTVIEPTEILFWIKDQFTSQFENLDLYFSFSDFLGNELKKSAFDKIVHLDIETWFVLDKEIKPVWDSPWGAISRPHYSLKSLSINPLTHVYLDESSFLQFSKAPAASEPGPMIAGRGTRTLLIDVFYKELLTTDMLNLFQNTQPATIENKISSQFKAMENSQSPALENITNEKLKKIILELIEFELIEYGLNTKKLTSSGHLTPLLLSKVKATSKKDVDVSWTERIFKNIKPLTKVKA